MYKISIFNSGTETVIHYPSANNAVAKVFKADLDEKESQVSQLTLDIPFFNPGYNLITDRVTLVRVVRVSDNVTIWRGRAINTQDHMDENSNPFCKEVLCEDELGYLCDTQVRAQDINNLSTADFLNLVINSHNAHTTSDKQFVLGTVAINTAINTSLNFDTSLNTLITNLVNASGGILALRYGANDTRYIDYLSTDGNTNNTVIALAKNMRSLVVEKDVTNIATRIIPIGKDNLTIASVNSNIDYLQNTDAVNQFGVVEQKVDFSDITDATALKTAGQTELDQASKAQIKVSVTAYDLSTIGVDASSFFISNNVRVTNSVMNFDDTFRLIEKVTDLTQPFNITLTFNNKFERLADKQVQMQRTANFVNQISDSNGVNTYYLRNAIDATRNMIVASGAYKDKKYIENQGFLLENTDETDASFGALYLGPTGLMISNTKDSSGNWVWTTFGTGAGFTADLIIVGKILGGAVEFNLDDGYLKINHTDGSYTLIDADGINRYNGTTKQEYHYLSYSTVVSIPANTGSTIGDTQTVVQLPDEFKGKNIQVSTGIKQARANFVPSTFGVVQAIGSGASVLSYNDATVTVTGNFSALDYLDSNHTVYSLNQYLQITLTAIA